MAIHWANSEATIIASAHDGTSTATGTIMPVRPKATCAPIMVGPGPNHRASGSATTEPANEPTPPVADRHEHAAEQDGGRRRASQRAEDTVVDHHSETLGDLLPNTRARAAGFGRRLGNAGTRDECGRDEER